MFPLNTPLEVIQLIYSWSAFSTNDVWVVQHFLNPLLFYMVFQNVWYSLLAIYVWESIEAFELTACGGTSCLTGGGEVTEAQLSGFVTDNMIGDILQGVLGILTGMLLRIVLEIPDWTPSLRTTLATPDDWIWLKRVLFFVALFLPSLAGRLVSDSGVAYGMALNASLTAAVLLGFAFWNQTSGERRRFWTLKNTKESGFQKQLYWRIYGVWLGVVLLVTLTWYLPLDNAYWKIWLVAASLWIGLLLTGLWRGKAAELIDFATISLFSIWICDESVRFLHDKKRFQHIKDAT